MSGFFLLQVGVFFAALLALAMVSAGAFAADDTIKVGVLHSLSGTMAISETTLKDTMLMLIEEQNKKGGVLGRKLEAVVVDPVSLPFLAGATIDFADELIGARFTIDNPNASSSCGCGTSFSV